MHRDQHNVSLLYLVPLRSDGVSTTPFGLYLFAAAYMTHLKGRNTCWAPQGHHLGASPCSHPLECCNTRLMREILDRAAPRCPKRYHRDTFFLGCVTRGYAILSQHKYTRHRENGRPSDSRAQSKWNPQSGNMARCSEEVWN